MLHTTILGQLILEKKNFFHIWALRPSCVTPTPGGYMWNLVTNGLVVSEGKSFESMDGRWMDGRRRMTEPDSLISCPRSLRLR